MGAVGPAAWQPFALLVIDAQRAFFPAAAAERFPDFAANVGRLLAFCRGEGLEVVHLRAQFRPDGSDWMARPRLRGRIPCVEGTPGVETLPFAVEQPGEAVFVKQAYDGFQNPALAPYLRAKRKRLILTAGLVTSVCVLLTAASAAQQGFLVAVVEDCCADVPEAHEYTLERYEQLLFDRVTVDSFPERYASWCDALRRLDERQRLVPEASASAP